MSAQPREIGTLIVVILKARNLPNKRHIGKQDPYCTVELNGDARRTKAIKRGGQHPEWDEEIRFTLYEDQNAHASHASSESESPPPPSKKPGDSHIPHIQGGKFMKVASYAEYLRDPEFIGETRVDLTEVLTKGETDEWFTLMNKGKYSGEVYLELTFWSNEPPPAKKASSKPKVKKQYGGPGSFVPSDAPSSAPSTPPAGTVTPPRDPYSSISNGLYSHSSGNLHETSSEFIPSSLRASNSIVKRDLYTAPYETARSHGSYHSVDSLVNDFAELGVQNDQGKPAAYLSPSNSFTYPPSSGIQHPYYASASHSESQPSYYDYEGSSYTDETSQNVYDQNRPITPGQPQGNGSLPLPFPYQAPYESSGTTRASHISSGRAHGPRYSLPTSSSGFMPISTPAPSVFMPPQPSGYLPPRPGPGPVPFTQTAYSQFPPTADPNLTMASVPASHGYESGYGPPPRTPVPSNILPVTGINPSSSAVVSSPSYQATPPPNTYYQQYPPAAYPANTRSYAPPAGPPPQHAIDGSQSYPLPLPPGPPQTAPQGPTEHGAYTYQTSLPYSQVPPPPTLSHSTSSPLHAHASRPLPQPSARVRRHSMVTGTPSQISMNDSHPGVYDGYSYSHIPPLPALPVNGTNHNGAQIPYIAGSAQQASVLSGPPPPPPPSTVPQAQGSEAPARHHSLNGYSRPIPPPPPLQQQHMQQQMNVPPPPPMLPQGYYHQPLPPSTDGGSQHPGPLPRPPHIASSPVELAQSPVANVEWR